MGVVPLLEPIRAEMDEVERLLQAAVTQAEAPLRGALAGALLGGKRLRPALVILAGRACGASGTPFHRLGAALDMLHAATLIHDDLVDGAALRRGRATLHTAWPTAAAVLAGDYMLGEAVTLVAELGSPRIVQAFGGLLRAMAAGQIADVLGVGGADSRASYERAIEAKTASLFVAAMEMAGLLAAADEPELAALRGYGRELGLAFQIADDVLDLVASEAELGKPAAGDLRRGLATLPVLCYLERVQHGGPVRAVLAGRRDEALVQAAVEAIRASGAIEEALAEAGAHVRQAQAALAALPEGEARQLLGRLAEYVIERN